LSVVACYSSKGGVGKTAAAVNLSFAAAERGIRTLLLDLDQQGAASFYFRVRPAKGHRARWFMDGTPRALRFVCETDYADLHILPAHISYRKLDTMLGSVRRAKRRLGDLIEYAAKDYELIFLDCPPNLGLVAENIFRVADTLLVPLIPTTLSKRTFYQVDEFFERSGYDRAKLRPFFSMVDVRKRMHRDTRTELRASEPRLLATEIPLCAQVEAMGTFREPVLRGFPGHRSSQAFRDLLREVIAIQESKRATGVPHC